ncbi:uncharacterized protein LOC142982050 [Anticarsia gemmatalis]|uniref:uncharacterized protein LOC142982050 n=1 Tax=Anticarsia gemmatalis TaxID=129554 RepID=UPI003F75C0E0
MFIVLLFLFSISKTQCFEIRAQGNLRTNKGTQFISQILDEISRSNLGNEKTNLVFRILKDSKIDKGKPKEGYNDVEQIFRSLLESEEDGKDTKIVDKVTKHDKIKQNKINHKKTFYSEDDTEEESLLNSNEWPPNLYGDYKNTDKKHQTVGRDLSKVEKTPNSFVNQPNVNEKSSETYHPLIIIKGNVPLVYKTNENLKFNGSRRISYPINSPGLPKFTKDHLQGDSERKQCFLTNIQYYYDRELEELDCKYYEEYGKPYPDHLIGETITNITKKCSVSIISYGDHILNSYWDHQYVISKKYRLESYRVSRILPEFYPADLKGIPYKIVSFLQFMKLFHSEMYRQDQFHIQTYGTLYPERLIAFSLRCWALVNDVEIISYGGKPNLNILGNHTFEKGNEIELPAITFDDLVGEATDKKQFLEYIEKVYKDKLYTKSRDYFEKFGEKYPYFLVVQRLRGLARNYKLNLISLGGQRFDNEPQDEGTFVMPTALSVREVTN